MIRRLCGLIVADFRKKTVMMEQVWKLLAELPLGSNPDDGSARQQVVDALHQFNPGFACLERIGTAVAASLRKVPRNSAGKTVCVRIYLSGLKRADLVQKQSWGFFVVDKSAAHAESLTYIDLFLFTEGDV